MKQICPIELCTGCGACISVCSYNAIVFQSDKCGFNYPVIDSNKCVSCSICEKVCPIINENLLKDPILTYVAVSSNNYEQLTSTSGGLASVFARYVITEEKGVVYGCTGEDCHHVRHIRIDSNIDITRLKGSKYVQSDLLGIYYQVKKDLIDGKVVLFIGTPCQNAGLRKFLRKDFKNFYSIDFICHGTPSQKMLSDHISDLGLSVYVEKVAFRYKRKGKLSEYRLQLYNNHGKLIYNKSYGVDYYMSGFLLGLFYRDSCYACKFAKPQRIGDITIGDYWDKEMEYTFLTNSQDGLSQMHINTEKGKILINKLSDKIEYTPIELKKLIKHSLQLKEPMKRHVNSTMFARQYPDIGFKKACKNAMKVDYKNFKRSRLAKVIFLIPGSNKLYNKFKHRS